MNLSCCGVDETPELVAVSRWAWFTVAAVVGTGDSLKKRVRGVGQENGRADGSRGCRPKWRGNSRVSGVEHLVSQGCDYSLFSESGWNIQCPQLQGRRIPSLRGIQSRPIRMTRMSLLGRINNILESWTLEMTTLSPIFPS
jgi:hypothetical protein